MATKEELYDAAIKKWGIEFQELMLVEECAEVIQAYSKKLRNKPQAFDNFIEELADLEIMLEQIKHHHLPCGISILTFDQIKRTKLHRLAEMLEMKYLG